MIALHSNEACQKSCQKLLFCCTEMSCVALHRNVSLQWHRSRNMTKLSEQMMSRAVWPPSNNEHDTSLIRWMVALQFIWTSICAAEIMFMRRCQLIDDIQPDCLVLTLHALNYCPFTSPGYPPWAHITKNITCTILRFALKAKRQSFQVVLFWLHFTQRADVAKHLKSLINSFWPVLKMELCVLMVWHRGSQRSWHTYSWNYTYLLQISLWVQRLAVLLWWIRWPIQLINEQWAN